MVQLSLSSPVVSLDLGQIKRNQKSRNQGDLKENIGSNSNSSRPNGELEVSDGLEHWRLKTPPFGW